MATQSPFSFLENLVQRIAAGPQPPQWMVHEVQQRVVLLLNHVLMQEREAMGRLLLRHIAGEPVERLATLQSPQFNFPMP